MSSSKLITVFILLISFATVAQAQTQRSTFDWNGNTYDVINPADVTLNESLGLELTPQDLTDTMGSPDSIEGRYSELTGYDPYSLFANSAIEPSIENEYVALL